MASLRVRCPKCEQQSDFSNFVRSTHEGTNCFQYIDCSNKECRVRLKVMTVEGGKILDKPKATIPPGSDDKRPEERRLSARELLHGPRR